MTTKPHATRYITAEELAVAIAAAQAARAEAIAAAFAAIGRIIGRLWRGLAAWLRKRVDERPPISPWLTHRF
jgi:hypothetical protein